MVIESDIPDFWTFLTEGGLRWLIVVGIVAAVGLLISFILSLVNHGPKGPGIFGRRFLDFLRDLGSLSPRRTWAMASLAFMEAWRRRVWAVLLVFFAVLLFAPWFLRPDAKEPARLYIDFVMFSSSLLVLGLSLVISAFSMPADIANKTIHTVVTKPVRSPEILLGRVLGFTGIGTVLLFCMGLVGYFFVDRGLGHGHEIVAADLVPETIRSQRGDTEVLRGKTGMTYKHAHVATINLATGDGETDLVQGHRHLITAESESIEATASTNVQQLLDDRGKERNLDVLFQVRRGEETRLVRPPFSMGKLATSPAGGGGLLIDEIDLGKSADPRREDVPKARDVIVSILRRRYSAGPPLGLLTARVAHYADALGFRDKQGQMKATGISVGYEWEYRSYLEGATPEAALWKFTGLKAEDYPRDEFPDGLRINVTLSVFRSHKGEIDKGVVANIVLRNEKTGFETEPIRFTTKEFETLTLDVPYSVRARRGADAPYGDAELWRDILDGGDAIVQLQCDDVQQFLGVAKRDVYFLASEKGFLQNFAKGYLGIWMQMVLIIGFGVMFGTFLNAFVSLMATFCAALVGYSAMFVLEIATQRLPGGGALESAFRLLNRDPITTPLNPSLTAKWFQSMDFFLFNPVLWVIVQALPDLSVLGCGDFVASGYDVPWNMLAQQAVRVLGFMLPLLLMGHYIFKGRELAK
ncbi:MAG: hypothetical protein HYS13_06830 [Planctomycetia bacterium]|nr:hypothetical protein [Planctomycetia bacterium]